MSWMDNMSPDEFFRRMKDSMSGGGGTGFTTKTTKDPSADPLKLLAEHVKELQTRFQKVAVGADAMVRSGSAFKNAFNRESMNKTQQSLSDVTNQLRILEDNLEEHNEQLSQTQKEELRNNIAAAKAHQAELQRRVVASESITRFGSTVSSVGKQLGQTLVASVSNIASTIQSGGSGFQIAGAAAEAYVDGVNQVNQGMSGFATQTGGALMAMGGRAKIAGMGLMALGSLAGMAGDALSQLAKAGIRIMVAEGDKLIKTYHDMAGAGVIFGDGIKGMANATQGTRLRLEDMAEVVSANKENLASMGIGMAEATRRIGAVAKVLKDTKMDRELLALGYSYKEQAALAAETMANMKRGAGGAGVTDQDVAQETKRYAENLRLIATLTGEDAKARMEKVKQENTELAFEMQKAKMSPKQRAELEAAMAKMSKVERDNLRDRMVFGTVVNKSGAILEAQLPALRERGEAYADQLKNNNLTAQGVAQEQARTNDAMQKQIMGTMDGMATAGAAGIDSVKDANAKGAELLTDTYKNTPEALKKAEEERLAAEKKAREPSKKGDAQSGFLDAQEAAADLAKALQEKVIANISLMPDLLRKYYAEIEKIIDHMSDGGAGATSWLEKLTAILSVATTALTIFALLPGGMKDKIVGGIESVFKSGGTGWISRAGSWFMEMSKSLWSSLSSFASTAFSMMKNFATSAGQWIATQGPGLLGKVGQVLTKAGPGLLKGGVTAIAGAAFDYAGDKLKESGYEKTGSVVSAAGTAAEWAGIGMMLGSVVPGIGTALGGAIGGIAGAAKGIYDNSEGFKKIYQDASAAIGSAFSALGSFAGSVISTIGSGLSSIGNFFAGTIGSAVDGIKSVFGSIIESISKLLGSIGDKIKSILPSWLGGGKKEEAKTTATPGGKTGESSVADIRKQASAEADKAIQAAISSGRATADQQTILKGIAQEVTEKYSTLQGGKLSVMTAERLAAEAARNVQLSAEDRAKAMGESAKLTADSVAKERQAYGTVASKNAAIESAKLAQAASEQKKTDQITKFNFSEMKLAQSSPALYKEFQGRRDQIYQEELAAMKKRGVKMNAEEFAADIANVKTKQEFAERAAKVGAAEILERKPAETKTALATPAIKVDPKLANDWAWSIFSGKATMNQVPAGYASAVADIVKSPPAHWAAAAGKAPTTTTTATAAAPATGVGTPALPTNFTFSEMKLAQNDQKLYKEFQDRKQALFDQKYEDLKKKGLSVGSASRFAEIDAGTMAKREFAERASKVGAATIEKTPLTAGDVTKIQDLAAKSAAGTLPQAFTGMGLTGEVDAGKFKPSVDDLKKTVDKQYTDMAKNVLPDAAKQVGVQTGVSQEQLFTTMNDKFDKMIERLDELTGHAKDSTRYQRTIAANT